MVPSLFGLLLTVLPPFDLGHVALGTVFRLQYRTEAIWDKLIVFHLLTLLVLGYI